MQGITFNIQKFSIHDGPGIRTTVFFKGCPLSCKWCSNPESQNYRPEISFNKDKCQKCLQCLKICPTGVISELNGKPIFDFSKCIRCQKCVDNCPGDALTVEGEYKDSDEIVKACLQDKDFYEESGGGVTISGGEGMAQPEFLLELTDKLKGEGLHLAVETTGCVAPDLFKKLAPQFDLLLYDVKHYDRDKYKEGTGRYNDLILSNLKWALKNGYEVLCRIPVIPGFNDSLEDANGFSKIFHDLGINKVQLLPFHQFGEKKYEYLQRDYTYRGVDSLHPEDLIDYQNVFINEGIQCFF